MTPHLKPGEPLADGLRRIALAHMDQALAQLTNPTFDRDTAVHEARKTCKRIRAILRLVRDEIGGDFYHRENVAIRDASRVLAPARDSFVMVQTLDALLHQDEPDTNAATVNPVPTVPTDPYAALRQILVDRHQTIHAELLESENAVTEFVTTLRAVRLRVAAWPIHQDSFNALHGGIKRVYKRGRRALHAAYAASTPAAFHEWRKRTKYLWHQLEILNPIWPAMLSQRVIELHDLSDYLGDDHDLAVLHQLLTAHPDWLPDAAARAALLQLIEQRRLTLETAAYPLGSRLFADKPALFVNRIRAYWKTWRQEHPVAASAAAPGVSLQLPETAAAPLLSTQQAAEQLGVSLSEVRQMIRSGRLPAVKIGQNWLLLAAAPDPSTPIPLLSTRQVAAQLGVSPAAVRRQIANNTLPAVKVGRSWLIRQQDVTA